jgi:hypothetical protein
MHADRTNRIVLLLLALLLIAVGVDAGAASIGAYGAATRHSLLMANPTGNFIGAQGAWLWPVAAVAAVIVVLLALRWLLALLFSTDRTGDLPISQASSPGRTTLAAGALTEAVAQEIESYRPSPRGALPEWPDTGRADLPRWPVPDSRRAGLVGSPPAPPGGDPSAVTRAPKTTCTQLRMTRYCNLVARPLGCLRN